MPGLFPPDVRVTAYQYAWRAGLLTGNGDLEFLRCLGLRAWHLAQYWGVPEWPKIAEGPPENPFYVWLWPEVIWDIACHQMAEDAARFGEFACADEAARQPWQPPDGEPGYGERAAYG
jgi:hypothetical protein